MADKPGDCTSDDGCSPSDVEALTRRNIISESIFSAFNGVFMGMILFAGPVIAVASLEASTLELTIIACAFPCGAFLGPFWVGLGRRWGMQKLVTQMALLANLPLFLMPWIDNAAIFTAVITISQLLHSAMRMGMSAMYGASYPRGQWGRILGWLTFCTFCTMVPTVLTAGWLTALYPQAYKVLFPIGAVAGLIGCRFYAGLRPLAAAVLDERRRSLRSRIRGVRRVVVRDRAYMYFQLAFFLSGSAFFMSSHVVLMMSHEKLGFGADELAVWLSVVPQMILAVASLVWGRIMDRIGIVRARLLISAIMTVYLACYFGALAMGLPALIVVGSILRGLSEGGGQVTWALASNHFAPRHQDVPLYNGIHFMLNGVRGLVMPWVGTLLFILTGAWTVLIATLVSAVSIAVCARSLRFEQEDAEEPSPPVIAPPEEVAVTQAG